jgi:predicted HD superfamily hydrolase involved in NAD metabolism
MDFAELSRALEARMEDMLSPRRAEHSRRVAELSAVLCQREGLDPWRGRAAGLAHDICKELPRKAQAELAAALPEAAGYPLTSSLLADKVIHGPAAAFLLARDYQVDDSELLEAIALHTLGRPGMGKLPTILYCADKLEPGRERLVPGYRESCLAMPLEAMLLAVVEGVVEWMRSQGKAVAPETMILYSSLTARVGPP